MKKFRILVVDDNGPFRQTLKESLQMSFPAVAIDEVADGGEVLREVDAFLPDLIIYGYQITWRKWLGTHQENQSNSSQYYHFYSYKL
jgi:DNA-binding response OmpR family regulator